MKQLKVTTTASAIVTLDGLDINDVIKQAVDLAHEVLEELSIYRQRHNLDSETFSCEASCCRFLDCNTTLQRTFELGKQEMKQQLMAKAVDAIVQPYDAEIWLNSQNDLKEFAEGEEVKVIILKKDGYE